MRWLIFFLIVLGTHRLCAQDTLKFEIDLSVDNDAFYLIAAEDEYYSSGIFATFRKSIDPKSSFYHFFNKSGKVSNLLQGFHFSHLMYTPNDIEITDVKRFDRPYAGGFSLGYSLNLFLKNNWIINFQQDLGIIGPAAGTGRLQYWWHKALGMNKPRGWKYEINNTPLINSKLEILKSFKINKILDFVYESEYEFGSIFNNIRQGGTIRLGNLSGIGQSGYRNGLIGTPFLKSRVNQTIEWYIFWGIGTEFVFYNATIEGNLIGQESVHTEVAEDRLLLRKSGLNIHWQQFDFGIHFYYNSAETTEADEHRFIRIRLTQRF